MDIQYDNITNEFIENSKVGNTILPQIIWHITDKCYLNCPYCFATKTGNETSTSNLDEIILLFKELGIKKVDIAGGDPMTYENLDIICERLHKENISQTITTSGTGDKKVINWLISNYNLFSRIIFSVDGSSPEAHDNLRGKGVYDRLEKIIEELHSKNANNIRINTVVTNHFNKEENCMKVVSLIEKLNPIEWCLIQTHPANKKEKYDEHAISDANFEKSIGRILSFTNKGFRTGIQITERWASNYSKYWILSAQNIISQHTEGATDSNEYKFTVENLSQIKEIIKKAGVWIPLKKE